MKFDEISFDIGVGAALLVVGFVFTLVAFLFKSFILLISSTAVLFDSLLFHIKANFQLNNKWRKKWKNKKILKM